MHITGPEFRCDIIVSYHILAVVFMPSALSYDQSTITSKVSDVIHVYTLVDRAAVGP